jgi:hypothetical protein
LFGLVGLQGNQIGIFQTVKNEVEATMKIFVEKSFKKLEDPSIPLAEALRIISYEPISIFPFSHSPFLCFVAVQSD